MKRSSMVCRVMRARTARPGRITAGVPCRVAVVLTMASCLTAGCAKDRAGQSAAIAGGAGGAGGAVGAVGAGGASAPRSADDVGLGDLPQTAQLDAHYIIGPTPARKLDYRIDWQTRTEPYGNSGVKLMAVQDDSIYVLDGENFLTRLRRDSGDRIWRLAVAEKIAEIQGITYMPGSGRVYLAAGANLLVLDAVTGAQVGKQHMDQVANTGAIVHGPMLIYGSRNGQIVWQAYAVGTMWKAYQIASSIQIEPLLLGDLVIAIGAGGRVAVVDASRASMIWSKTLLDNVVAAPTAGNGYVYVAGLDQHLWAFNAATGQTIWRYLTESPLTESPVLMGDRLYQQVPSKGLVCFEAVPANSPGGKVIWTAAGVPGSVVNENRGILMVWDKPKNQFSLVSAARGNLIDTVPLGRIKHLYFSGLKSGEMYAASDDGSIIRLAPRN